MYWLKILKPIIKKIKKSRIFSFLVKHALYIFLRALFATYRLQVQVHPSIKQPIKDNEGVIYFWHQNIISGMYFFFKSGGVGHCIISPSSDGKFAGFICQKLNFSVLYGSSYKTSVSLVRKSLGILATERRLCLVGDGSRGPAFQLQPGIKYLAAKSSLPVIFIECNPVWAYTFKKSWDQFKVPLPFSKIMVTVHKAEYCHELAATQSESSSS